MIKIKINYEDDFIKGFKVSGHANYDDYGKDIVCASVSSVVITSVNIALKIDENAVRTNVKSGLIEADVMKKDEIINKVFLNMIDMLKQLKKDYEKNIKIIIE